MRLPVQIQAVVVRFHNGVPEFLLMKRIPEKGGFWQTVSGGYEETDTGLLSTCYREFEEELGLTKADFIKVFEKTYMYRFETDPIKNKEQSNYKNLKEDTLVMTVFVYGFQVPDNFDVDFTKFKDFTVEHTEYRWVTLAEAEKLLAHEDSMRAMTSISELIATKNNV